MVSIRLSKIEAKQRIRKVDWQGTSLVKSLLIISQKIQLIIGKQLDRHIH